MSELKPCPFCGEKPRLYVDEVDLNGSATADSFSYYCDECDFSRGEFLHVEQAEESWNSRAELTVTEETNRLLNLECEELKGDVEKLKNALQELVDGLDEYGQEDVLVVCSGSFEQAKEILDK